MAATDVTRHHSICHKRHAHDGDDNAGCAENRTVLTMNVEPRLLGSHRLRGFDTGSRIQRQAVFTTDPPEIEHQRRADSKNNDYDNQHSASPILMLLDRIICPPI